MKIIYNGAELDIYGNYFAGAPENLEQQSEPESFDIELVYFKGEEISRTAFAIMADMEELESLCIKQFKLENDEQ